VTPGCAAAEEAGEQGFGEDGREVEVAGVPAGVDQAGELGGPTLRVPLRQQGGGEETEEAAPALPQAVDGVAVVAAEELVAAIAGEEDLGV
jgi:hypothetical protein